MRLCQRARSRRWYALLLLGAVLVAADAGAATAQLVFTPVEIAMLGPEPIRVRVSEGTTFPCDSMSDHMLVQGRFSAGQVIQTWTRIGCVCIQQTHPPFADVDWSEPFLACRPLRCSNRSRPCPPAPDPTIRVQLESGRGG